MVIKIILEDRFALKFVLQKTQSISLDEKINLYFLMEDKRRIFQLKKQSDIGNRSNKCSSGDAENEISSEKKVLVIDL